MLSVKKARRKFRRLLAHGLTPDRIVEVYPGEKNLVGIASRSVMPTAVGVAPHGASATERVITPRHRLND